MPVPNTVTFRRSATEKHYEYSTDLEALGMEAFSSGLSRAMAVSMGINPGPEESTTPVCISMDVSKEGRDLRLDGIVRTSLALHCCRYTFHACLHTHRLMEYIDSCSHIHIHVYYTGHMHTKVGFEALECICQHV
jgi:hypothetical protein